MHDWFLLQWCQDIMLGVDARRAFEKWKTKSPSTVSIIMRTKLSHNRASSRRKNTKLITPLKIWDSASRLDKNCVFKNNSRLNATLESSVKTIPEIFDSLFDSVIVTNIIWNNEFFLNMSNIYIFPLDILCNFM